MSAFLQQTARAAAYLPRLLLMVAALSAPVLAMPHVDGRSAAVIEGVSEKSKGFGFVLLVSLQR